MRTFDQVRTAKWWRIAILVIRWTVPIVILVAFALSGHLGDAISALSDVRVVWAVPLILVGIALPLSHAWRWSFLLKRAGANLPVSSSVRLTALASLLNYAAPGFLGAPAKALFARDSQSVPLSRSIPTLVVEQLLDALFLFCGGAFSLIIAGPVIFTTVGYDALSQGFLTLVVAAIGASIALIVWRIGQRLFPEFVVALRDATRSLIQSSEHRRSILALTGTRWALDMVAVAIASFGVGLRLGFWEILLVANLSLFVGLIAPVPGGLGVREAVMASIAGVLGISVPAVLALSILHRAGLAIGLPLVFVGSRLYEWSER